VELELPGGQGSCEILGAVQGAAIGANGLELSTPAILQL
jgi:hypothetical protein